MLIQPAANTATLERIMQAAGKGLILVTVADEAGIEINRLAEER
jgi:hypothetical protein